MLKYQKYWFRLIVCLLILLVLASLLSMYNGFIPIYCYALVFTIAILFTIRHEMKEPKWLWILILVILNTLIIYLSFIATTTSIDLLYDNYNRISILSLFPTLVDREYLIYLPFVSTILVLLALKIILRKKLSWSRIIFIYLLCAVLIFLPFYIFDLDTLVNYSKRFTYFNGYNTIYLFWQIVMVIGFHAVLSLNKEIDKY